MEIKIRTEQRKMQHYAAIRTQINMNEIPTVLPPLIPQVMEWLKSRNIEPAGKPFFNYFSMNNVKMEVEVGYAINEKINGEGDIIAGKFEAGDYVIATYFGPYSNLRNVHIALEKYARENAIITITATEFYITDPETEPDQDKWQTDIAALIADR